ncbi:Vms1/Ankzf1 family peptidyl-tRNA hydrolase [Nonomuraea sp. NPDC050536]|uniref:baeRF2 domain-containing protein n=1 Tax=Nonomuraea sp. NPDC050536 TaxID=3364366 RepID=UPI0037C51116
MRLDFIRPLYERPGPYASVYLAGRAGPEEAAHWRGLRDQLSEADTRTLEAMEKEAARPAEGLAMFATHGEVVLAEAFTGPPAELAEWSPLPYITPMLMLRGENVPHLRVIVDLAGAELTTVGGGSPRIDTEPASTWPLLKTARGGWARTRYERGEYEATAVAHEIDEQVRRIGADLVVMAGEPRSRSLLCDHLGTKAADRLLMVERTQADRAGFARDAENALDGWLDRRRAELLERYAAAPAVTGMAQVGRVLREGRAQAILMPGELAEEIWIGPGSTQLSPDRSELRRWGVEHPVRERADSAVARAAAMTDAELWFCPRLEDVAAVVRY